MRHIRMALVMLLAPLAAPALAQDAAGVWTGAIDNHLLTLIRIEKTADGDYSGTFSDHEQPLSKVDANAVTDTALTHVSVAPYRLQFEVPAIGSAIFDGTWRAATQQWVGTFQWGKDGYKSHLALRRTTADTLADALKPRVYASAAEESADLEALIESYVGDGRFTGSVLVSRDGKALIDKGYGLADAARGVTNTPATRYQIASITKSFTATAILILQDRGKLSIDEPVNKYIPGAPKRWDGITLRHLLQHTSGLGDHNPLMKGRYTETFTPAQLLDIIRRMPLSAKPGKSYQYSNAGYTLLGMVVEKASGQSYGDFLRDAVFAPLGMDATAYAPVGQEAIDATGYNMGENAPVPAERRNLSNTFAAGGLVSTTHDLLKWQEALFGGRLVSTEALAEMKRDGLGIAPNTLDGQAVYSHSGHLPGFVSDAAYQPDGRLSVIVLANLDNSTPLWLSRGLTTIAHGFPAEVVPLPRAIEVSPALLEAYAGVYRLMPGVTLSVAVEGGHLMVQATGQEKIAAYAETQTMFFARATEAKLEFVRDARGRIGCILHQAGQHIAGVR